MTDERRISDAAVTKATGKGWAHWLGLLERWGAAAKGHKATAKHLQERHGVAPWWAQTITVRFEKERGLREKNQVRGGYQISVTRTIDVPLPRAWQAWTTARAWNRWFTTKSRLNLREGGRYTNADGDTGEFRAIVPGDRLRFTWDNPKHCPGTLVEVRFAELGERCRITVQHSKLASKRDAEAMRGGWSWAMDSLRSWLETGKPITHEAWLAAKRR
ncbi:SRPBCC domain-containing protein [bacterium]|nr:SRPBCC domain-containing protein [bacterium]